jgi:G3E family GTPase
LRTTNEKTTPSLLSLATARGREAVPAEDLAPAIPIYVIAGFLGSGKTTLLKRLLRHLVEAGGKPAVLMNEFAGSNIDGALLHAHEDDHAFEMRAILNGCVCCDLSEELGDEIKALLRSSAGPVLIETTGLASVGLTADVVSRALAGSVRRGRLASVIAVVDARRFEAARRRQDDPAAELSGADTVILNKVDGLSARAVSAAEARIRALNPGVRVFRATYADVDAVEILAARREGDARMARCDADVRPAHSIAGFESVTANLLGSVHVDRLARLLETHDRKLARVKGFIRVAGTWGFQELQWVPGAIEVKPRKKTKGIRSHLVVLGRDMDWDEFATGLDDCVEADASPRRRSA